MHFDPEMLARSQSVISRECPTLVASFLETLGWRYPSARRLVEHLFGGGNDIDSRVAAFATRLAQHVHDPAWLGAAFAMLCATHPETELQPHVVGWIREVMLETLEDADDGEWGPELRAAWWEATELVRARAAALRVAVPRLSVS